MVKKLYNDINCACANALLRRHRIFKLLDTLGIFQSTTAATIKVAPSAVSLWASGREPIPPARFIQLLSFAQSALRYSQDMVSDAIASEDPIQRLSAKEYAKRVNDARKILEEIQSNGKAD
ncbi:MAG: hypothetical protein RPU34_05865 [Candidatus Sedimenticola sp. (ex Thyasira tokunagai)]